MSTNFPITLDAFPSAATLASHKLGTDKHSDLHGNLGDAVAALEAKVGVNGSLNAASIDYFMSTLAARQDRANTYTTGTQTFQTIVYVNVNSASALIVEQNGAFADVLAADTASGRVGVNKIPTDSFDVKGTAGVAGNIGGLHTGGQGGGFIFTGGLGGDSTSSGAPAQSRGGNGGGFTVSLGGGGAVPSATGGAIVGGAGGNFIVTGGIGGAPNNSNSAQQGGSGGGIQFISGQSAGPTNATSFNSAGGSSGTILFQIGNGQNVSGSTATNTGSSCGNMTFACGSAGQAIGGTTAIGGNSSSFLVTGQPGGLANGNSTATTATGGNAGNYTLTLGAGGAASGGTTSNGGNGGSCRIDVGVAGVGTSANGTNGGFVVNINGTNHAVVAGAYSVYSGGSLMYQINATGQGWFGAAPVARQANASQAGITAVTDANARTALQAMYNLLVAYGLAPATA